MLSSRVKKFKIYYNKTLIILDSGSNSWILGWEWKVKITDHRIFVRKTKIGYAEKRKNLVMLRYNALRSILMIWFRYINQCAIYPWAMICIPIIIRGTSVWSYASMSFMCSFQLQTRTAESLLRLRKFSFIKLLFLFFILFSVKILRIYLQIKFIIYAIIHYGRMNFIVYKNNKIKW